MGNSFKMAMRRLAATVNVITCESNGVPFGMTATAVTALSADPESLLICINRAARICATIEERRAFCVNILATHHADVSQTFGGMAKGVERFDIGTWECAETGLPYLVDAQANVFCDLDHFVSYGTHNVFFGRVTEVRLSKGQIHPLLYCDGRYLEFDLAGFPRDSP